MSYPNVIGEFATLAKLQEGYSLARFGDGELSVLDGKGYVRQYPDGAQAKEMRRIISKPKCLVGIPPLHGPKLATWEHFRDRFVPHLSNVQYYSALISRPDCAPWIECREYIDGVRSLWAGKKAVVVGSEPGRNKLHRVVGGIFVECPFRNAYEAIDDIEAEVRGISPDIALLSAGPTATCLANRLCDRMQAIDLGSIGGFLLSWQR